MTRTATSIAALAIALVGPATAADIKAVDSNTINISGPIKPGDFETFIGVFFGNLSAGYSSSSTPPTQTVVLNSDGGLASEAYKIAQTIRISGLTTKIPDGSICNSACSFIWLAGVKREIDCLGRIGLHSPRKEEDVFERSWVAGNKALAHTMKQFGAPKAMIDLAIKTHPEKMAYVDYVQLRRWGLVNDRVCDIWHANHQSTKG